MGRSMGWVAGLAVVLGAGAALASEVKRGALARNQTVRLMQHIYYDMSCAPTTAPNIWVWQHPKLGRIDVRQSVDRIVESGPCRGRRGGVTEVFYTAGPNAGLDEFVLMPDRSDESDPYPSRFQVLIR